MDAGKRFQINATHLVDYILSIDTADLPKTHIKLVRVFINGSDSNRLVELFIDHSRHIWEQIKEADEKYFLDNAKVIFGIFSDDKINSIMELIEGNCLTQKSKIVIWKYFASFVKISIKWIYENRSNDLKVHEEAKLWQIKVK
uniref:Uncharacterized protein n=1 Tax=Pithovirus LCPAC403 TaxID=2506596 RepID=A0A481ZAV0_9VIRU|nr:MAG: uncharacterized protein LCPAC403_01820 [Pithovirus LCPAC403]